MADLGAVGVAYRNPYNTARIVFPPEIITRVLPGGVFMPVWTRPALTTRSITRMWRAIFTPPWWGQRPIGTLPLPDRQIEGHVYQRDTGGNDAPINRCRVRLYYRPNGVLVANAISDAAGYFKFTDLMPDANAYYAVAFDPDGTPVQNALIYDLLTPAP